MATFFKVLMAVLYIAAGVNHFINPGFYEKIMPPYIPLHYEMVLLSGVAEIALGVMLLIPRLQVIAAWGIIAMLAVFLTVHIHMLAHADQYSDVPVAGLWARLFAQGLLIWWAWLYTRRSAPRATV